MSEDYINFKQRLYRSRLFTSYFFLIPSITSQSLFITIAQYPSERIAGYDERVASFFKVY